MEAIDLIQETLMVSPELLLRTDAIQQYLEYLWPKDAAIEIECPQQGDYRVEPFLTIGLVECLSTSREQRYRFPPGLDGAISLYKLCQLLPQYLYSNDWGGIHYHTDMRPVWNEAYTEAIRSENKRWILAELDTWNYDGGYNSREVGKGTNWCKFNDLQTMEIRMGEMTFDYSLILKRILHCQSIGKRIRELVVPLTEEELELRALTLELNQLTVDQIRVVTIDEVEPIIRNRRVRL